MLVRERDRDLVLHGVEDVGGELGELGHVVVEAEDAGAGHAEAEADEGAGEDEGDGVPVELLRPPRPPAPPGSARRRGPSPRMMASGRSMVASVGVDVAGSPPPGRGGPPAGRRSRGRAPSRVRGRRGVRWPPRASDPAANAGATPRRAPARRAMARRTVPARHARKIAAKRLLRARTSSPSSAAPARRRWRPLLGYSARTLSPTLTLSMATSLPAFTLNLRPSGPTSVTTRVFMSMAVTVTVPLMPTFTSPAGFSPGAAASAGGGAVGLDGLGAGRLQREDDALADGDLDDGRRP